jgi:hypothetical protein
VIGRACAVGLGSPSHARNAADCLMEAAVFFVRVGVECVDGTIGARGALPVTLFEPSRGARGSTRGVAVPGETEHVTPCALLPGDRRRAHIVLRAAERGAGVPPMTLHVSLERIQVRACVHSCMCVCVCVCARAT